MAAYKQLSVGADDEEAVKKLQKALNDTGKYGLSVDGIYGKTTQEAVKDYQKKYGLAVDGVAGEETLGHLYGVNGGFTWENQGELDQSWEDYLNREDFSYDYASDPLYQQYKDQYVRLGNMAAADTMGMAAALTGGYGNSYAQTAGQQAYQNYLMQLNNVMPELYGMAYDRYRAEGEALYNEIVLRQQQRQQAYQEFWDTKSWQNQLEQQAYQKSVDERNWQNQLEQQAYQKSVDERNWNAQQAQWDYEKSIDERNWQNQLEQQAYQKSVDERNWNAQQEQWDYEKSVNERNWQNQLEQQAYQKLMDDRSWQLQQEQWEYQKDESAKTWQSKEDQQTYNRQQDSYSRLSALIATGYTPTDEELAAAGMTRAQADALASYYKSQSTTQSKPVVIKQDNIIDNGGYSDAIVKFAQSYVGADQDGLWGTESKEKAKEYGGTVKTVLEYIEKKGKTAKAEKFLKEKGSEETWASRGVSHENYLAMVQGWLDSAEFTNDEFYWLCYKVGLLDV